MPCIDSPASLTRHRSCKKNALVRRLDRFDRSSLRRILGAAALILVTCVPAMAGAIPRPGKFFDPYPIYDTYGTPRNYGDPETSKYQLYTMERLSIGGPWRNDAPVVIPKPNYSGDFVIDKSSTNADLDGNPPIYRITRPGESTNLLPSNFSNEEPVRTFSRHEHNATYGFSSRIVTIEGVTSTGLALGTARGELKFVPGKGPDGLWNPPLYPSYSELPPGLYPPDRFAVDLKTGQPVVLDAFGYEWSSHTGYEQVATPSVVDLLAVNDKGEMLGHSRGARNMPLYYSSPDAAPEILASMVSTAPGEGGGASGWAISAVTSIDDNGIIYGVASEAGRLDARHKHWGGEKYHVAIVPRGMAPPFDVAPAPVPEPSTWLMGVGMIAAAAWKRRRQGCI